MAGGASRPKAATVKVRIKVTEFQTVFLLLSAGIIVVMVSVYLSVVCGETKAMMEYMKSLGTLIFGAVLALIQAARAKTAKPTDPTEPQPPSPPQP